MKSIIIIIISSVIFTSCSFFGGNEKHFIWQIEDEDSKVYVLGSIHLGKKEIFPLDSVIENAYKKSDLIAVEVNTDNTNPLDLLMKATYNDNQKLRDNISPKTYEKLIKIFEKNGVPEMSYNKFKPWFAILTAMQLELSKEGYSGESGIDAYFMKKAKKDKKEIKELESIESQIKLLSSFDDIADEYFEYSVSELENSTENIDRMYKYWLNGNTEGIEKIIYEAENLDGFQEFNQKLIVERNFKMTDKIESYLDENKTYLVICGAGHLVGEKGIISILKNNSEYKINQL